MLRTSILHACRQLSIPINTTKRGIYTRQPFRKSRGGEVSETVNGLFESLDYESRILSQCIGMHARIHVISIMITG